MKKLLVGILTAVLLLSCLSSCSIFTHKKNQWFSEDTLNKCLVPDMPQLDSDCVKERDKIIYANLTEAEFDDYLKKLYTYLIAKEFKHFGTRGEVSSSLSGAFTTYYVEPATELSEFNIYSGTYKFVYSDGQISMSSEDDDFTFCILTVVRYEDTHILEYGMQKFDYNFTISLKFNSEDPLNGRYTLKKEKHDHTYEYAGNDYTHQKIYTCGCPTPDIAEMHYDNDKDDLCDACGIQHKHVFGEWHYDEYMHWCAGYCLWDACDIDTTAEHIDANNNSCCDVCGYKIAESPAPTNYFLRNQAGCEWLNEISAEDIAQIKITKGAVGVAPGMLNDITISSKSDVVAELFDKYYWLDTSPIPKEDGMICGGGAVTVQFILKTGEVKELYFNNGNYCDTNGNYFELLYTPMFTDEMNPHWCNSFITYIDTGIVYTTKKDDSSILPIGMLGEISVSAIEFNYMVEFEFLPDFDPDAYGVYVQTEFGNLHFISPTIFDYNGNYCTLVGRSIEDIIDTSGVRALVNAHAAKYNDGRNAFVEMYYGEYPSGSLVGMIVDDKSAYTEACWSETVGGYTFDYYYGNRIVVLYSGEFYTLPEALDNGCLTKSDIALIWSIHNY